LGVEKSTIVDCSAALRDGFGQVNCTGCRFCVRRRRAAVEKIVGGNVVVAVVGKPNVAGKSDGQDRLRFLAAVQFFGGWEMLEIAISHQGSLPSRCISAACFLWRAIIFFRRRLVLGFS
jgi:hypothetical protein